VSDEPMPFRQQLAEVLRQMAPHRLLRDLADRFQEREDRVLWGPEGRCPVCDTREMDAAHLEALIEQQAGWPPDWARLRHPGEHK
jgi:hypothetical protein